MRECESIFGFIAFSLCLPIYSPSLSLLESLGRLFLLCACESICLHLPIMRHRVDGDDKESDENAEERARARPSRHDKASRR